MTTPVLCFLDWDAVKREEKKKKRGRERRMVKYLGQTTTGRCATAGAHSTRPVRQQGATMAKAGTTEWND
jgi:hypothetical protein